MRLDASGTIQETLEAPQSYADARSAFGKLRHATTLDDGASLELGVGGVAKLSTKKAKKEESSAQEEGAGRASPAVRPAHSCGRKEARLTVGQRGWIEGVAGPSQGRFAGREAL